MFIEYKIKNHKVTIEESYSKREFGYLFPNYKVKIYRPYFINGTVNLTYTRKTKYDVGFTLEEVLYDLQYTILKYIL